MSTILLVDNDPLQAFLWKSILERRYDSVQRVRDAAEALCLIEQPQFADNLGLVVSDLNVPGFGSPEFVAELHERLPSMPVLVLGAGDRGQDDYAGPWVRVLARPFRSEEMLEAAGDLIAQHSREAA